MPFVPRMVGAVIVLALTISTASSIASAQQSATLTVPAGARPARHPRVSGRRTILDCANHGVWSPPTGWTAFALARGLTLAVSPSSGAALLRGSLRSRADRAAVAETIDALVGSHVALPAPTNGRADTTLAATIAGERVDVRWLQAGDALWVSIVTAHEAALVPDIDAARASRLQLVDHACEGGTDCEGPRR